MHFHVLTLFPEMIEQGMNTSIMGRAIERGYISLKATDIRDYAANKHNKVDDTPYGGGAGMVMQAAPVYGAYEAVKRTDRLPAESDLSDTAGKYFLHSPWRKNLQKSRIWSFCADIMKGSMSVSWKRS